MRIQLLPCLMPLVLNAAAQGTTTSVQDGDWSDPATWDCNCIPEVHNAEVLHQVRIAGNTFLMQRVHVTPVGSLVMDAYFSVVIMDTVINDGLMDLVGDIDVDWAMINNSTVHIDGVMHIDGVLTMGGPDALLALDDIGNYDTIEGEGRICVSGLSENTGTIQGEIDFCDLTPTVTSPPFIDVNSGTVAGSVSFCAAEPCGPQSVVTNAPADSRVGPNPANDLVRIDLSSPAIVTLRDPTGRAVISHAATQTVTLDVSMLPPGIYSVSIERGTRGVMHSLVIVR